MRHFAFKFLLVLALLGLCAWSIYPPEKKLRFGRDLQGGVSMIYTVKIPDGADSQQVIAQVTETLTDRVNPHGVTEVRIQPLGLDRVEVTMPLPNQEVRALQIAYRDQLESLLSEAQISEADLEESLRAGSAPARFGGTGPVGDNAVRLQETYNRSRALRTELQSLVMTSPESSDLATEAGQKRQALEEQIAEAEILEERLKADLLALGINQGQLVRALGLATDAQPIKDEEGKPIKNADGTDKVGPKARDLELTEIKTRFSHLASRIDGIVAAYDAYAGRRTALDDPEDLKRLLRGAGVLEFHIAVRASQPEGINPEQLRAQLASGGPESVESAVANWFRINKLEQWYSGEDQRLALDADPVGYFASQRDLVAGRSGDDIYLLLHTLPSKSLTHGGEVEWTMERVGRVSDDLGRPAVSFALDRVGGGEMGRLTGPHEGQMMAIVLDGEVFSAPVLQTRISGNGQITGNFSEPELAYLVRVLAAGSLAARLSAEPISTSILGPSIGGDNLRRGLNACLYSVIAVAICMIAYYFAGGVIAMISLLAMGLLLFGGMALLDSAFTLSGLAGVALTVGMAVDCNVLIYERIREEMQISGEKLSAAIRIAFKRAFNAIIDGQLANLIVSVVLVRVVTAEVKGFGVTMIIGVVSTLFMALVVTRMLLVLYADVFKFRSLPMLPTVFPPLQRALEPTFDWMRRRKLFFTVSGLACVVSVVLLFAVGRDMLDMEFRGGVTVTINTRQARSGEAADAQSGQLLLSRGKVEETVRSIGEKHQENAKLAPLASAAVLTVGRSNENFESSRFQVKVANPAGGEETDDVAAAVQSAIIEEFANWIDVPPELTFTGIGDTDFAKHTFALEKSRLGENIARPKYGDPVGAYLGGVAIVLDGVSPPITPEAATKRVQRMRGQPDFASLAGRDVRVVGLEPADPADPSKGFSSLAVLVRDNDLDVRKVELGVWDQRLAAPEWKLVSAAMKQASSLEEVSSFSSAIARTLSAQAVVAIVLSCLGILAYIWFRFSSLRYSVAAIVATMHDVLVALGALALTHYLAGTVIGRVLLIEAFRIDLNVIAALLTLIGYSLNDTVVNMDRIRENRGKLPLAGAEVINRSINQTMSRTLLTGTSSLIALFILYVQGGAALRPFSFVLLIGIVIGTYSSVTIAAPLVWAGDKQPKTSVPARRRASAAEPAGAP